MTPRRKRTERQKERHFKLMPRDDQILNLVGRMGQATSKQIVRCFFGNQSTGIKRLAKLVSLGYLDVSVTHLEEPNVYTLSADGSKALLKRGADPKQLHKSRVGRHPDVHTQYLNDLWVEFITCSRQRSDVTLDAFHGDLDLRRRAGRHVPVYIPDGIAELALPSGTLALIVEIDTGTEGQSIVEAKAAVTVDLWKGRHRCWGAEPGQWRPALFATSPSRARGLARAIVRAGGGELWLVAELSRVLDGGVFGPAFATAAEVAAQPKDAPISYRYALAPTDKEVTGS